MDDIANYSYVEILSQTLSFRDFSWVALGFGIRLTDTCMIWIVYCSVLSFSTELCIAIGFFLGNKKILCA